MQCKPPEACSEQEEQIIFDVDITPISSRRNSIIMVNNGNVILDNCKINLSPAQKSCWVLVVKQGSVQVIDCDFKGHDKIQTSGIVS